MFPAQLLSIRFSKRLAVLLLSTFALAACSKDKPQHNRHDIEVADTVFAIDFSDPATFETGTFTDGSSLAIEGDVYLIRTTDLDRERYLFGASTPSSPALKNVVIEVSASPRSGNDDNWFGVLCRLNEGGVGYAFLISADGFWAIARTNGTSLDFLENWRESDAIKTGKATNSLEAFCVEDYLALYINGQFAGDTTDNRYNQVGRVGLLAGGARSNPVTIAFDNLLVKPASLKGRPNTATPTDLPTATATVTPMATPQPSPIPLATIPLAPLTPPQTETPSN